MLKIFSPRWLAGWFAGWLNQMEISLNSASVEVEVEAEVGKSNSFFVRHLSRKKIWIPDTKIFFAALLLKYPEKCF